MSVKSAIITAVVEIRVLDDATEGEMVDEALCMIEDAGYTTRHLNGTVQKKVLSTTIEIKGEPGGSL